jgi:hypothetical protein
MRSVQRQILTQYLITLEQARIRCDTGASGLGRVLKQVLCRSSRESLAIDIGVELPTTIDVIELSHAPYVLYSQKTGIEAIGTQAISRQLLQLPASPVSSPARHFLSASQFPDPDTRLFH